MAQNLNVTGGSTDIVNDGTRSGTFITGAASTTFFNGATPQTYSFDQINYSSSGLPSQMNLLTGSSVSSMNDVSSGILTVQGATVGLLTNQALAQSVVASGLVTTLSNSGTATVNGGTVTTLTTGGLVTLNGGTVTNLNGGGTVTVNAGTVGTFINRFSGSVTISGGSIGSLDGQTFNAFTQNILMTGGSVTAFTNTSGSTATLRGGTAGTLTDDQYGILSVSQGSIGTLDNYGASSLTGGQVTMIDNFTNGTLDVFGQGLSLTDGGYLTGTLQDGQSIDALYKADGGVLTLHNPAAVPEASTTASFGLLLFLGLGSVVIAAKKKKATTAAWIKRRPQRLLGTVSFDFRFVRFPFFQAAFQPSEAAVLSL